MTIGSPLAPRLLALALSLGLALCSGRVHAELVEVRQVAGGMECAECARKLRIDVRQLDRVNASDASWNRRVLKVSFHPGSHATLEELRAVVRRHHFTVREAEIVARGRVVRTPSGGLQLAITGSDAIYEIASTPHPATVTATSGDAVAVRLARAAAGAHVVTIRARIAGDDAPPPGAGTPGTSGTAGATASVPLWILEIVAAGDAGPNS
jgi:hypothetical protein